jgi:hypothetical protein
MLVLYVVKPPVETVNSRHYRLSIDSQKSQDRDITDKLPKMLLATTKVPRMQSQYFTFTQVKSSAAYIRVIISKVLA